MCYYCPPLAANWCPTLPWAFHGLVSFCKEAMAVRLPCDQQLWYRRAASSFKKENKSAVNLWRLCTHMTGWLFMAMAAKGMWASHNGRMIQTWQSMCCCISWGSTCPNCQEWRSPRKDLSLARQLCARKQEQVLTSSLHFVLTFLALLAEQGFFQEVSYNKA